MATLLLEITTRCLNCGDNIAINAAVNKIWCPKCKGLTSFSNELWSLFLNEIVTISGEMHAGEARRTSVEDKTTGTIRVMFKKTNPRCNICKHPISNIGDGNTKTCEKCKSSLLYRSVPDVFKNKDFLSFINEDTYQIEQEKEQLYTLKPVEISCSNCGAPLQADGKTRIINCSFCKTEIMLPDSVWYRLHPSLHIRPWYFVFNEKIQSSVKPWEFDKISGICIDTENTLYCVGETCDNVNAIWAMNCRCELIWMTAINPNKKWPEFFTEIILLPDGNLLIWNSESHWAHIYDRKNGDFIKEFGDIEPKNSKIPILDFYGFVSLAADPDGSMVGIVNRRIMRFSEKGEGIYLWPKTFLDFQNLKPIYLNNNKEPSKRDISDMRAGGFVLPQGLKSKPKSVTFVVDSTVHIDTRGSMYILAPFSGNQNRQITDGGVLCKFSRKGKLMYKANLVVYGVEKTDVRTDSSGYAYVMMNDAREEFTMNGRIIRVSPDGKEVKIIAETTFASDICFAVANDGTVYTVINDNQFRVYSRNGEQLWRNETARKFDKNKIEEEDE